MEDVDVEGKRDKNLSELSPLVTERLLIDLDLLTDLELEALSELELLLRLYDFLELFFERDDEE